MKLHSRKLKIILQNCPLNDPLNDQRLGLEILTKTKDCVENNSFLRSVRKDGDLRSQFKRNCYYKNRFQYIAPIEILLGQNELHKNCYAQYVPIHESLQALLQNSELRDNLLNYTPSTNLFKSIRDGYMYKNNFGDSADVINIILYQDAFEPCNALGSSRGKHKILAFYYMLDIQSRSKVHSIQLLYLCDEKGSIISYISQRY